MPIVLRAFLFYIGSVLILRLLGKGLTFQQKPYDLVVMMIMGSASGALIVNREVPILNGLIALVILALLHTLISVSTLSNPLKGIVGGQPDILVRNGRIVKENLIKNQVNLNQLLAGLRSKGYRRLHDIEFAILEPSGQLSVIPKAQSRPVTPTDLELKTNYEGIPVPLIIDGEINRGKLEAVGLDMEWLETEISKRELEIDEVLLALLDTDGSFYISEQPPIDYLKAFFLGEGKDQAQGKTD
ncbi:DUF421 domain-containing protein [Natroniella sulfidigena]|uniref:DUF421 domain-containing protein n=1 Tax=Natroniella sulfidigena TaxID=723921 RepID=UPI00200A0A80|nr:DUF421 domain-containing protein [Natroniella sulfidigena]MCK8816897.1 DUF421 domain-containing protein [Natroniella sulfidigena]